MSSRSIRRAFGLERMSSAWAFNLVLKRIGSRQLVVRGNSIHTLFLFIRERLLGIGSGVAIVSLCKYFFIQYFFSILQWAHRLSPNRSISTKLLPVLSCKRQICRIVEEETMENDIIMGLIVRAILHWLMTSGVFIA